MTVSDASDAITVDQGNDEEKTEEKGKRLLAHSVGRNPSGFDICASLETGSNDSSSSCAEVDEAAGSDSEGG